MPHDSVLIVKVCELLEQEYSPQEYDYIIEKAIPGTRMYPDISVVKRTTKRIQCVVEIGYTKPEKLTAYRKQFRIPDVRWYDKQGNRHSDVIDFEQCITDYLRGKYNADVVPGDRNDRSVEGFRIRHGTSRGPMSKVKYQALKRAGLVPRENKLNNGTILISRKAETEWEDKMERLTHKNNRTQRG